MYVRNSPPLETKGSENKVQDEKSRSSSSIELHSCHSLSLKIAERERERERERESHTWSAALSLHQSAVAEACGAVWLGEGQEPLAEVVDALAQLSRHVGCLEDIDTHTSSHHH